MEASFRRRKKRKKEQKKKHKKTERKKRRKIGRDFVGFFSTIQEISYRESAS